MDFCTTFPLRYFINLGRRQDRRVETEIALAEAGISAERFPAVDARFVRRTRGYDSLGRYALALSQRMVIREAALKKADAVLVLEDDVVFHPEMLRRLREIELPDDWGIFYLGCAHHRRPSRENKGVVRVRYALDTHAFAVRAPYYRKVIAALGRRAGESSEHAGASDWFLADLHEEVPTYACYPNLAWQTHNKSDLVEARYSNYTTSGEQVASAGEMLGMQAEMWGGTRWAGWSSRPAYSWKSPEKAEGVRSLWPQVEPSVEELIPEPKLGLLFLTIQDVCHPDIWQEFKEQAGEGTKVFSHTKAPVETGFLHGTRIEESCETAWGNISLVRAMLLLLKAAYQDKSITHFAFLSETCIPVKPWAEIRRRLKMDPRSMMHFYDAKEMKPQHLERLSLVEDLPKRAMRTHSQWVLLDREAAACVTEHDFTEHFESVFAMDEHYFGTLMALRGYPDGDSINRQDLTWVKWECTPENHPVKHVKTDVELARELAAFPGFFARKFPVGSDIGKWGLHRH